MNFVAQPEMCVFAVLEIIEHHQTRGALAEGPALVTMNALVGPLLAQGMFHRANPNAPTFDVDVKMHVHAFLYGRHRA